MASIVLHLEGGDQRFSLESAAVTLGRGLESDIRLKDIKASRRHCQIVKTPQGYQLVDLSSGNGTYVNGVQAKQQKLNPGDKIQIGSTTLTFQEASAAPAAAKAPTAVPAATEKRTASAGTARVERPAVTHQTAVAATAVTAPVTKAPPPPPAQETPSRPPAARPPARASAPSLPAPAGRSSTSQMAAAKPSSGPFKKGPSGPFKKAGLGTRSTRIGSRPGTGARAAPEAPAKKKGPLLLVLGGVLLLALGGGAFFLLKGGAGSDPHKPKKEAGESHRKKEVGKETASSGTEPKSSSPAKEASPGGDFSALRAGILSSCKLGESGRAHWGSAIKEWKDYLEKKPSEENRSRAQAEIGDLNAKAKEEFGRLSQQVEGLSEDKKKAEAVGLLKENRARFEGTETLESLDKLIRDFEK